MPTEDKLSKAMTLVANWKQEHLLRFYDELAEEQREQLLDQILKTDFALLTGLYEKASEDIARNTPQGDIRPAAIIDKASFNAAQMDEFNFLGLDAIRQGQYAVVTMAGGQGTRLGFDGPKGTYPIQLDRLKSLFEIQLEGIRQTSDRCGCPIPWYIMTSAENHLSTVDYFTENNYFGYHDIHFFQQGMLPMVGTDGKILLDNKHHIKEGPDGNGSIFRALQRSGSTQDMHQRGIQWFFVCNVDNILVRCVDPLALGFAIKSKSLCVSKSVMKRSPGEKAGVFCIRDGNACVVEYTELPIVLAEQKNNAGELLYGDAHISCTLFSTTVLQDEAICNLGYHTACKKASIIGDDGILQKPENENAYKFEAFIFDAFEFIHPINILRINREEEFAPIKNVQGEDSLESAVALYLREQERLKALEKGI